MGYQALLFCPDEKAARTVTQVLGELDFEVIPCSEPFAAVKKMMGEHFDAVVVDCENEQNATLLFKSARSAPNSQSALAVAVVEGQAGVAKAFRIGANLVLTKPINVEQAKGTLRVARGLLRKSEAAKTATTNKPTASQPPSSTPVTLAPAMPEPSNTVAPPAPAPFSAPMSIPIPAPQVEPYAVAATPTAKPEIPPSLQAESPARPTTSSPSPSPTPITAGAAAAPAPAREINSTVSQPKPTEIPFNQAPTDEGPEARNAPLPESAGSAQATPVFSFESTQAKSPRSKKMLLALAAMVPLAAAGYFAWAQFGLGQRFGLSNTPAVATSIALRPTTAAVAAPSVTDNRDSNAVPLNSAVPPSATATPPNTESTPPINSMHVSETPASSPTAKASAVRPSKGAASEGDSEPTASSPSPHPIVVRKSAAADPSGPDPSRASPTGDVPAPGITAISTPGGQAMPAVLSGASSAPKPRLQTLSISQGVSRGLLMKQAQPAYPPDALRNGIQGPVQLLATVSKSGDISSVKILSGDARLAHAATDAVKQWKYKPYLLNGEPVEIQTQVTVNFKLPH
jgi:TonB family protein